MNGGIRSYEHFQEVQRQRRLEAYHQAASPIIRKMVDLRLMYTTPWMVVREGVVDESGETWTDESARKLYDAYGDTLRLMQRELEKGLTTAGSAPAPAAP